MKTLADVVRRYGEVMDELLDPSIAALITELYGIQLDSSPQLLGLCLSCSRVDTADQVADIVGGFLCSSWTLNAEWAYVFSEEDDKHMEHLPVFPESYGSLEVQRWNESLGTGHTLSYYLERRIGICLSYSFTLAIVLKVLDLSEKVQIQAKAPHMLVLTVNPDGIYDLASKAHGHAPHDMAEAKSIDL